MCYVIWPAHQVYFSQYCNGALQTFRAPVLRITRASDFLATLLALACAVLLLRQAEVGFSYDSLNHKYGT